MKYEYKDEKMITEKPSEKYKNRIYEFIVQNKGRAKPDEIKKKTGISLQTINVHLKELVKEWKIVKVAFGEYCLRDRRLGEIHSFTSVLKRACHKLINSYAMQPEIDRLGNIKPLTNRPEDTVDFALLKTTAKGTISTEYCETSFADGNYYERNMFEFANRIGAFIAYTFIESLRPVDWNTSNKALFEERDEYSSALIRKAIDLELIFSDFCSIFNIVPLRPDRSGPGRKKESISDIIRRGSTKKFNKVEEKEYERLSDLYRRVYPNMHRGLEEYWSNSTISELMESKFVLKEIAGFGHAHEWRREKMYKIDKEYYVCRICTAASNDPIESKCLETPS